jgi:hypothetical protein
MRVDQAERIRLLGYDFGLPLGRTETLALDLTPRRFQFNWSTTYSDQRTLWGLTRPETHGASSNRSAAAAYRPGVRNGRPVKSQLTVEIKFEPRDADGETAPEPPVRRAPPAQAR